jgi:hypothetical protein
MGIIPKTLSCRGPRVWEKVEGVDEPSSTEPLVEAPPLIVTSHPEADWFLSDLVQMANAGVEFPITLYLPGLIISGRLVSAKLYFDALGQQMSVRMTLDNKAAIAAWMERIKSSYYNDEEQEKIPPGFIHLVEAQSWVPNERPLPVVDGIPWRGRLSQVAGFAYGRLVQGR